jgi:hypothetical protein
MLVEPLTVTKEYQAQWFRPRIDSDELARLRWVKKWSLMRIAKHYKRSKAAICGRLKKLKNET